MSILVACQCGRSLKAPDALAGKKAKCPSCGTILKVQAAAPEAGAYELAVDEEDPFANMGLVGAGQPTAGGGQHVQQGGHHGSAAPPSSWPAPPGAAAAAGQAPHAQSPYAQATSAGTMVSRDQQRRENAHTEARTFGTVFGMDLTIGRLISWSIIACLLAVGVWWWFRSPVSIVSMQAVDAFTALDQVETMVGGTILNQTRPGRKGDIAIGGGDQVIITRPNADGDHLIVRLRATQQFLDDNGVAARYELAFRGDMFELKDESGNSIKGLMLRQQLDNTFKLTVGNSNAVAFDALYPKSVQPADKELKVGFDGGAAEGVLSFDGSTGATGQIAFKSYKFATGNSQSLGLFAQGQLQINDPNGVGADYDYTGEDLELQSQPGDAMWYGTIMYAEQQAASPYSKWEMTILFKRPPQTARNLTLCLNGKEVRSLSNDRADQSSTTFVKADTTPRKQREQVSNPLSKANKNSGKPQKPVGVLDYFDQQVDARNTAKGLVSVSNMRQIAAGIVAFRDAHQGRLPKDVDELIAFDGELERVMRNPLSEARRGYIYVKPEPDADLSTTPILYESLDGQADPKGLKGYADGRVE